MSPSQDSMASVDLSTSHWSPHTGKLLLAHTQTGLPKVSITDSKISDVLRNLVSISREKNSLFCWNLIFSLCVVERRLLRQPSNQSLIRVTFHMHASAATVKPLDAVYHSALKCMTCDDYDTLHCEPEAKAGRPPLTVMTNLYSALHTDMDTD